MLFPVGGSSHEKSPTQERSVICTKEGTGRPGYKESFQTLWIFTELN